MLDKLCLAQRCTYALPLISVGAVCVAYVFKSRLDFKEKERKCVVSRTPVSVYATCVCIDIYMTI